MTSTTFDATPSRIYVDEDGTQHAVYEMTTAQNVIARHGCCYCTGCTTDPVRDPYYLYEVEAYEGETAQADIDAGYGPKWTFLLCEKHLTQEQAEHGEQRVRWQPLTNVTVTI
jgi:hypothetical protein